MQSRQVMNIAFFSISAVIYQRKLNQCCFSFATQSICCEGKAFFTFQGHENEDKYRGSSRYIIIPDRLCRLKTAKYPTLIDNVTSENMQRILQSDVIPSTGESHGEVISRVSSAFLGTPYQADTLIGGADTPEVLVANFNHVDCFTLIDYVEALTEAATKNPS